MRIAWNWSPWRPRKRAFERAGFVFRTDLIAVATECGSLTNKFSALNAPKKLKTYVFRLDLIAVATINYWRFDSV